MISIPYLSEVASNAMAAVTKVLINDTITIAIFDLEHVTANIYECKYRVHQTDTNLITNVKLLKADNSVVTDDDVSIPIPTIELVIRQTITVTEVTA